MASCGPVSWRRRLGLERRVAALAWALLVYGFGEELWSRYLPEYLRFLGASALLVGVFARHSEKVFEGFAGLARFDEGLAQSLARAGQRISRGERRYEKRNCFFPFVQGDKELA